MARAHREVPGVTWVEECDFTGFDQPWRLLAGFAPDLHVTELGAGAGYLAVGHARGGAGHGADGHRRARGLPGGGLPRAQG